MTSNESASQVRLYREVYGTGDPILFLHGLGANIFTWRSLVEPFSRDHKVILVDFKGNGKSPKPLDSSYSVADKTNEIYQLIMEEDLINLTLVGNSLGGGIALLLAIRLTETHPGRLKRLVLIDSAADKRYVPFPVKVLRSFLGPLLISLSPSSLAARLTLRLCYFEANKITAEQVKAYAEPLASKEGKHAFLQTVQQCIPENTDELLSKLATLTVPTFILWGRQDKVIPLAVGEILNRAIPNSTLEVLDECGHIPQEEKPAETIALISRFLATS
ncbi:MAG TPA: alpha/beta hydrolase [Pyrinomonadaceae bacterium]|nr:alpha/beta hydrolase [Pyrinomonadaceae bacterium]